MLLEGKVGVVSGVGPGLGKQVALAFAREGADVALGARTEATLKETAAEVEALGRRAVSVPTDVTDPEQVYAGIADNIALGYLPPDEDCAEAVVFLASDRARSITGQTIDVNGGEVFA